MNSETDFQTTQPQPNLPKKITTFSAIKSVLLPVVAIIIGFFVYMIGYEIIFPPKPSDFLPGASPIYYVIFLAIVIPIYKIVRIALKKK